MRFAHFTKRLYEHLHLHCSFIAHYNRLGFYAEYFERGEDTARFLSQFDSRGDCRSVEYGGHVVAQWRLCRSQPGHGGGSVEVHSRAFGSIPANPARRGSRRGSGAPWEARYGASVTPSPASVRRRAPRIPRPLCLPALRHRKPMRLDTYALRTSGHRLAPRRDGDTRRARQARATGQTLAPPKSEAQASCVLAATGALVSPGRRRGT